MHAAVLGLFFVLFLRVFLLLQKKNRRQEWCTMKHLGRRDNDGKSACVAYRINFDGKVLQRHAFFLVFFHNDVPTFNLIF